MTDYTRRRLLNLAALSTVAIATSACVSIPVGEKADDKAPKTPERQRRPQGRMPFGPEPVFPDYASMYAPVSDGGFNIPGVPWEKMDERYLRKVVRDPTGEPAGSIVVDTRNHFLYLVLGNGNAVRYGVGLGRAGFEWSGRAELKRKSKWPKWHPPEEMIEREPKLEKYRTFYDEKTDVYSGGMDAGPTNPLGARAHYIYQNGKDTLYRLHGSPEWNSIGKSVSSGCVRLMNQDVIDLYNRTYTGAPILVK